MYDSLIFNREILRKNLNPGLFFVLNVLFISLAQSVLLFLIATPAYVMILAAKYGVETSVTDSVLSRLWIGCVLFEYLADQQQWGML